MKNWMERFHEWFGHLVRTICRMLILGVTIAGLILLLIDGIQKFYTSSEFTVEEITIAGNQRVTTDEIRLQTSIAPGSNIWLLDLGELSKRLEEHSTIRRASVRRIPPRRIHIDIVERQIIAFYLLSDGTLMGLDAGGVALPPPASLALPANPNPVKEADIQSLLSYPLISGDVVLPDTQGLRITDPHLLETLLFLEQVQNQSPDFFREIVEAEWQENGNFIIHMRRRIGVVILRDFHSPDLVKKIHALWHVMEKDGLRAVYVDGRFPDKGFAVHADSTQSDQWEILYKPHESI